LFWESKKLEPIRFLEGNNFIYGVVLKREDVLTYLDSVLNFMNFNSKEKTDFITYWGPRLVQKDYSFVQFQIQDDCNQFAKYEIYPTPDNLNRLFILFYCFDNKQEFHANLTKEIKKQEFKSFSRSGFNLLEWGGIEIGKIK